MEQDPTPDGQPLDLIERTQVLDLLAQHLTTAWNSFDRPRPREPGLDRALQDRLAEPLPAEPGDAAAALDDAAHVLDASVSPARPPATSNANGAPVA